MVVKDTLLVIVHPWDLGPLDEYWTFRGLGHNDIEYEHHIHDVVRPHIESCMNEEWIGIAMPPLELDRIRIHPAIDKLQDFVLYDDADMENIVSLDEIGVTKIRVGGYGWDSCVRDFYRVYKQFFDCKIYPELCLPTIENERKYREAML